MTWPWFDAFRKKGFSGMPEITSQSGGCFHVVLFGYPAGMAYFVALVVAFQVHHLLVYVVAVIAVKYKSM